MMTQTVFRHKMIFSDIDGTLLDSSHQISENTKKAILTLEAAAIPFVLVSARMPAGVTSIRSQLGNHAPMVCYSGGLIYDSDAAVLYSAVIDMEKAWSVRFMVEKEFPELCCNIYCFDKWLVEDERNPWVLEEEKITEIKAQSGSVEAALAGESGIHKFLLMGEPEVIKKAEVRIKLCYPELSVSASKDTYLEITHRDATKSSAVRFLCAAYGVPPEEAIAFGDGENDIDMLCTVKNSYAMGNAPASVKQSAAYIARDNDHEGILHVLKQCYSIV